MSNENNPSTSAHVSAPDGPLLLMSTEFVGNDSKSELCFETRRILEAAAARDIETICFNPCFVRMAIRNNVLSIDYWDPAGPEKRKIFEDAMAIMVRDRWGYVEQTADLLRGISVADEDLPMFDPVETYDRFTSVAAILDRVKKGIPMPDTIIVPGNAPRAEQLDLRLPMITKGNASRRGQSVQRLRSRPDVDAYVERSTAIDASDTRDSYGILAQEEILNGREFRVFVIDGRAVAAAERIHAEPNRELTNEFLSENVEFIEAAMPVTARSLAETASRTSGASFSGVDVFETEDGQALIIECNRNPQFRKLEQTTGFDVAGAMLDHVLSKVAAQVQSKENA